MARKRRLLDTWLPPKEIVGLLLGMVIGWGSGVLAATWLAILPVVVAEMLIWRLLVSLVEGNRFRRVLVATIRTSMLAVLVITAWMFVVKSSYVLGSPRLRGLVKGISVPPSDFSWSTNGSVVATPMDEEGRVMKIRLTLRDDKPCADAGWGLDLLRWNFADFRVAYDPNIESKDGIAFCIRGEKAGEAIGISMKSDRVEPSPGAAASDEGKLPLSKLGVRVTTQWKRVRVPFSTLPNFAKQRARNVAFYTDRSLLGPDRCEETVYLKGITFYAAR